MSLWLDERYLKQIGYRLDGFKQLDTHQWVSRCPICGDSAKKKTKKRGYFYEIKGGIAFHCFNCQASNSFGKFLKEFDVNLYKQYSLDKFRESHNFVERDSLEDADESIDKFILREQEKLKSIKFKKFFIDLPKLSDLESTHPAVKYVNSRKIPEQFLKRLYYSESFVKWTTSFTDKYAKLKEHPRLIIPFFNSNGNPIYFQGRSFGLIEPRYFTYKIDQSCQIKAYGLDRIQKGLPIYVVEGPIDSMFLPNGVAVASSALHKFHLDRYDHVYVFDNEPRNPEICALLKEAIDEGKKVVIWPNRIMEKDINDMVMVGRDVIDIIENNTFQHLSARLKYNEWVK